jgi:L-Ala-D/L-Glu epimerase
MAITRIDIFRYSIPMQPFTIATGTMHFAQNVFIRVHTDAGFYGVGECSAFPMIVGETQETCLAMARDFAALWKGKDERDIEVRINELHLFTAGNATVKSAFDMALYDLAAKNAQQPLYAFLGGKKKKMHSDLTIGIDTPERMAAKAVEFKNNGVTLLKIKLGKEPVNDVERIKQIRTAVGPEVKIRIDANQGWSFEEAVIALQGLAPFDIEFCEQPMRHYNDHLLPDLRHAVTIPVMADESVFDHHDAERLIRAQACDSVNIKFAKSSGILEAKKIAGVCSAANIPCMMGGMLESRVALTAFAHFAASEPGIIYYDMDTCLLGHLEDPVTGGVQFENMYVVLPDSIGLGADVNEAFLEKCEHWAV